MIDKAPIKSTEAPPEAKLPFEKCHVDQRDAASTNDYDAATKRQAWGAFIGDQQPATESMASNSTTAQ